MLLKGPKAVAEERYPRIVHTLSCWTFRRLETLCYHFCISFHIGNELYIIQSEVLLNESGVRSTSAPIYAEKCGHISPNSDVFPHVDERIFWIEIPPDANIPTTSTKLCITLAWLELKWCFLKCFKIRFGLIIMLREENDISVSLVNNHILCIFFRLKHTGTF